LAVSDFLLFAVFGLLFCLESVILSGRGTVIIYSHLMNKWEYSISGTLPFFGGKHLSLKTLIPPLGAAFITTSHPIIISSSGFILNPYEGRLRASGKNSYRYTDVKTIGVSGSSLLINGISFCSMHSESEAAWWKEKLIRLTNISPGKRSDFVNEITASMFDLNAIADLALKIFTAIKPLRIIVNILYFYLFIAAPLLVLFFSFEDVLIPVLTVLLFLHAAAVTFFYRSYRAVFNDRGIPWAAIVSIAFYPPALIRSVDYFYKDSFLMFNAAAVSLSLIPHENSKKLISFLIREYNYFNFATEDNFEQELVSFYRKSMLAVIKQLLEKESINYDELLIPPAQHDDIELYCPRCFCQYTGKVRKCEDCSIDLIKY